MIETWRDIPGYEGHYQISPEGVIKSLVRDWVLEERILTVRARYKGARTITLIKFGDQHELYVDKLLKQVYGQL